MNFIGPLSNKITKAINKIKNISLADILTEKPPIPVWKKLLFEMTIRTLVLCFYPLLYIIILIDYLRSNNNENISPPKTKDDNLLYYWKMGGAGTVTCNNCNYKQKIVSFLHGHDENSWNNTGFQCQECGKFHEIEYDMNNSQGKICICGGVLSRDNPLFCPTCMSKNMRYSMSYIT